MTACTYVQARDMDGHFIGISDGSRHALALLGEPGVPAAAQRRLNVARMNRKPPRPADMALVAAWLDANLPQREWVQAELWPPGAAA